MSFTPTSLNISSESKAFSKLPFLPLILSWFFLKPSILTVTESGQCFSNFL